MCLRIQKNKIQCHTESHQAFSATTNQRLLQLANIPTYEFEKKNFQYEKRYLKKFIYIYNKR